LALKIKNVKIDRLLILLFNQLSLYYYNMSQFETPPSNKNPFILPVTIALIAALNINQPIAIAQQNSECWQLSTEHPEWNFCIGDKLSITYYTWNPKNRIKQTGTFQGMSDIERQRVLILHVRTKKGIKPYYININKTSNIDIIDQVVPEGRGI
jgi:hypothetical protein